ncbi:MAG TPA: hypothetical protein VFX74_04235 [Candidatus Limnocylindria bacterium]|nr:hypothetical protein [Candidatus Limnocylindria bacterium]
MTTSEIRPPGVIGSFGSGVANFVGNAWRFLVANLIFGAIFVVMATYGSRTQLAYLLAIVLILPVAGLMRMAAVQVRTRQGARMSDFLAPMRRPWHILLLGTIQLVIGLVMWIDVVVGLGSGQWLPAILAIGALYLLLGLWSYALIAWPLLLDPLHDGEPVRARLSLALQVLLTSPMRVLAFAVLSGLLLGLATAAVGLVVTVALALIWLSIASFSLTLVDRFEARAQAQAGSGTNATQQ